MMGRASVQWDLADARFRMEGWAEKDNGTKLLVQHIFIRRPMGAGAHWVRCCGMRGSTP